MHDFADVLFSQRDQKKIEDFYKKSQPPTGIKVCYNACTEKGLYAAKDFDSGDEIFRERCLVGLQVCTCSFHEFYID